MNRFCMLIAVALCVGGCTDSKDDQRAQDSNAEPDVASGPYEGQVIDAHGHVMPTWAADVVPTVLSEGGLSGYVVLGLDNTLSLQTANPETYSSCAFFEVSAAEADPEGTLSGLRTLIDRGARCIGEVSVRHFPSGPSAEAREHDANSDVLQAVYRLARNHSIPVNVHFDYSEEHIGEFEAALASSRTPDGDTVIVWAHSGDAPAAAVSALMDAHSNLHIDLSSRNPLDSYSGRLVSMEEQRLDDGAMVLKEGWAALMEAHSDRVLVGTDVGPGSRHLDAVEVVGYYRTLLGQLSPAAADRIAHENARELFGF